MLYKGENPSFLIYDICRCLHQCYSNVLEMNYLTVAYSNNALLCHFCYVLLLPYQELDGRLIDFIYMCQWTDWAGGEWRWLASPQNRGIHLLVTPRLSYLLN